MTTQEFNRLHELEYIRRKHAEGNVNFHIFAGGTLSVSGTDITQAQVDHSDLAIQDRFHARVKQLIAERTKFDHSNPINDYWQDFGVSCFG